MTVLQLVVGFNHVIKLILSSPYYRCSCGEVSSKESSVTKGEEYEMKGSRGTANLVQKVGALTLNVLILVSSGYRQFARVFLSTVIFF